MNAWWVWVLIIGLGVTSPWLVVALVAVLVSVVERLKIPSPNVWGEWIYDSLKPQPRWVRESERQQAEDAKRNEHSDL